MVRSLDSALSDREHEQRERILTQPAPTKARASVDAVVLKRDELFMLTERSGDVPIDDGHALGLYLEDCRYLAGYELRVDGRAPVVLGVSSAQPARARHELACEPDAEHPGGRLTVSRRRHVEHETLVETLTVRSFAPAPRRARLELRLRAGFEDIFVLKGFAGERGRHLAPRVHAGRELELAYEGVDGRVSELSIAFDPVPSELHPDRAMFELELAPGTEQRLSVRMEPRAAIRRSSGASEIVDARPVRAEFARVDTSDPLLSRVLGRAFSDLRLLRSEHDGLAFYEAGVPWFATLFGRDAALVAMQLLPYDQRVAADTLRLLARYQAKDHDDYRDAEPGKILHELRSGELARARRIPQSPAYYGTIDATLLFVILSEAYFSWTCDRALVAELAPALRAALAWSTDIADHDGDWYLDYSGCYEQGLVNQGWKDSGDAIVTEDGSLARPPVALSEVQAYAYRAWLAGARLARELDDAALADGLERRARDLRERFERDLWWDAEGVHVLALHGEGTPARVVTSNAGQVLWGGITSADRAARIAARLARDDMWSGWGVRTLSSEAAAYDPASYHRGTVWPHDNALILSGLRRYGHDDDALRIFDALYKAAAGMRDRRLPELWSGYAREPEEERPIGYPVACSPQAWAASALPFALTELLGIEPDAAARRLVLRRPILPSRVRDLAIEDIPLGEGRVSLWIERSGSGVELEWRATAGIRVERVDETLA